MIYCDGAPVHIGDTVQLGGNRSGVVVGIIDENQYADGYNAADWNYLRYGVIVSTDFGDLRLDKPDEDLELVGRVAPKARYSR